LRILRRMVLSDRFFDMRQRAIAAGQIRPPQVSPPLARVKIGQRINLRRQFAVDFTKPNLVPAQDILVHKSRFMGNEEQLRVIGIGFFSVEQVDQILHQFRVQVLVQFINDNDKPFLQGSQPKTRKRIKALCSVRFVAQIKCNRLMFYISMKQLDFIHFVKSRHQKIGEITYRDLFANFIRGIERVLR